MSYLDKTPGVIIYGIDEIIAFLKREIASCPAFDPPPIVSPLGLK